MSSEIDTFNKISLVSDSVSDENFFNSELIKKGIELIREEYPFVFNETLKDFIETFKDELNNGFDPIEKFQLFLDVNYYPDIKDQNVLNQISELSNQIKKIEISNDINLYEEEKKLKSKLRSIQKKYSFLPQNGKRKAKGGHTALYRATLVDLELKDLKMIYKGDFNTKKGTALGFKNCF